MMDYYRDFRKEEEEAMDTVKKLSKKEKKKENEERNKYYSDMYTLAMQKYFNTTGVKFGSVPSIVEFVVIIAGKTLPKQECWNIIESYVKDYEVITDAIPKYISIPVTNPIPKPKMVERRGFYSSALWKRVRVAVIEECEGRCQMCGRSYKNNGVTITVDHIVPISIDWSKRLDKSNLQILCEDCNYGKGNSYITDWRKAG